MLNEEQQKHMAYLASLRPDQKCDCGWARRGECFGRCYGNAQQGGAIPQSIVDRASDIASGIAAMIIRKRLLEGGTVEIPSLGITLTAADLKEQAD